MIASSDGRVSSFETKSEGRFVVFQLGAEKFGANIDGIKEVLTVDHITAIPRAPEYVIGVINLRGAVCTVIDLLCRLTVRKAEFEDPTEVDNRIVMIMEIGKRQIGMAVDNVASIMSIPSDLIESQLDMVKKEIHTPFLEGIAKMTEDDLIILLNVDAVFSEHEVDELLAMAERKAGDKTEHEDELIVSKEEL